MSTFLRVIGAFALFGAILFGLTSPMALIPVIGSGIVSCVTFWWMASLRDAADEANETLDELAELLRAIAMQSGASMIKQEEPAQQIARPKAIGPWKGR